MTEGEKQPWYKESEYFEQNLRRILPERKALYGPEDNMVKLGEQLLDKPPSEVAKVLKSLGWNTVLTAQILNSLWVTASAKNDKNGQFVRLVDGFVKTEHGRSPIITDVRWD